MRPRTFGLAVLTILAVLAPLANAQKFVAGGSVNNGIPTYPGNGSVMDFALFNGGYANFGQPAIYPNYSGRGAVLSGANATLGGTYSTLPLANAPATFNNLGRIATTIRPAVEKPVRSGYEIAPKVPRARRGR